MREKSAGAVIYRQDKKPKYLLLLYGAGHWDYVKGHVDTDEEEEETVVREAEEEAGLIDLRLIPGFKEIISYEYSKNGKKIAKEVVFYLAETQTQNIKLSFEHKEYKWLEFAKAVKKVTYPSSRAVLRKADKFLKKYLGQKKL
ncbi:NUDIX domain-containing protein [Candidatus Woesearchaeota archaeon]|nr:NUDIX domain-containing protein [Candidatus Woesearchaeota archaeon]